MKEKDHPRAPDNPRCSWCPWKLSLPGASPLYILRLLISNLRPRNQPQWLYIQRVISYDEGSCGVPTQINIPSLSPETIGVPMLIGFFEADCVCLTYGRGIRCHDFHLLLTLVLFKSRIILFICSENDVGLRYPKKEGVKFNVVA